MFAFHAIPAPKSGSKVQRTPWETGMEHAFRIFPGELMEPRIGSAG